MEERRVRHCSGAGAAPPVVVHGGRERRDEFAGGAQIAGKVVPVRYPPFHFIRHFGLAARPGRAKKKGGVRARATCSVRCVLQMPGVWSKKKGIKNIFEGEMCHGRRRAEKNMVEAVAADHVSCSHNERLC